MDIGILKSLMEDGQKLFRAVSREIKVSPPTIKARYDHPVNMALIRSVKPEIGLSRVNRKDKSGFGTLESLKTQENHFHADLEGLDIKLKCEFCSDPIHGKAKVLRFADFERFFCCTQCRPSYNEKHSSLIELLKEQCRKH